MRGFLEGLVKYKSAFLVSIAGVIINLLYFGYGDKPLVHGVIFLMIPLFLAVGYLTYRKTALQEDLRVHANQLEAKVKEKTEELRKAKHDVEQKFDSLNVVFLELDPEGRILSINRKAEEVYGISKKDAQGVNYLESFLPDDFRKPVYEDIKKVLSGKPTVGYENPVITAVDEERIYSWNFNLKHDESGKAASVLAVGEDITRRKRAEENLKKLEESNRSKDLFGDIMHHDLINPLTVAVGTAQLMLEEEDDEDKMEDLNVVLRNLKKIELIVEASTKLSHLKSGQTMEFQRLDLGEMLRKVVDSFRGEFKRKRIKVVFGKTEERYVNANPILEDVFVNLLSNAVKYSPPGSVVCVSIAEDEDSWIVCIADEGEGIPDEHKKVVFERFERGGKRGVKGSGLGLAIVKRITELHKGETWVEDNQPQGSKFYVRLRKL